mmetsp:Transcript_131663/g.228107  ORF Transcript_131663/g.228107 Transcript_131663/m.228107 type:complete len:93 (-) Transcript_131663:797-1075(-)
MFVFSTSANVNSGRLRRPGKYQVKKDQEQGTVTVFSRCLDRIQCGTFVFAGHAGSGLRQSSQGSTELHAAGVHFFLLDHWCLSLTWTTQSAP